jgi:hypothetical protein
MHVYILHTHTHTHIWKKKVHSILYVVCYTFSTFCPGGFSVSFLFLNNLNFYIETNNGYHQWNFKALILFYVCWMHPGHHEVLPGAQEQRTQTASIPPHSILLYPHPIPFYPILFHPTLSHFIWSHPIPSYLIPFHLQVCFLSRHFLE